MDLTERTSGEWAEDERPLKRSGYWNHTPSPKAESSFPQTKRPRWRLSVVAVERCKGRRGTVCYTPIHQHARQRERIDACLRPNLALTAARFWLPARAPRSFVRAAVQKSCWRRNRNPSPARRRTPLPFPSDQQQADPRFRFNAGDAGSRFKRPVRMQGNVANARVAAPRSWCRRRLPQMPCFKMCRWRKLPRRRAIRRGPSGCWSRWPC